MPDVFKICEGCGGTFPWRPTWNRYCSRACAWAHGSGNPQRRPDTDCAKCGRLFHRRNPHQRYCSYGCRPGLGRPRSAPDHICAHCGRIFRPKYGRKGKRAIRYCARGCYFAAKAAARVRICPRCGKSFTQAAQAPRKYCSRNCARFAKPPPLRICETCGNVFRARNRDGRRVRHFCSPACCSIAQRRPKVVLCLRCYRPVPKPARVSATKSGALRKFPRYCSDDCRHPNRSRRRAITAVLRVLRQCLVEKRQRLLKARQESLEGWRLGAFCLLACPNCGGQMPRDYAAYRRRWCSKRCAHQMRKRYSLWTGLTGRAQYEMLLTVGLMKKANRLVEDVQKGTDHGRNSEDADV